MKKYLFGIMVCFLMSGCYQRTTAPTYSFDEDEVETIRQQLGAKTSEKDYINEEEEESEED